MDEQFKTKSELKKTRFKLGHNSSSGKTSLFPSLSNKRLNLLWISFALCLFLLMSWYGCKRKQTTKRLTYLYSGERTGIKASPPSKIDFDLDTIEIG